MQKHPIRTGLPAAKIDVSSHLFEQKTVSHQNEKNGRSTTDSNFATTPLASRCLINRKKLQSDRPTFIMADHQPNKNPNYDQHCDS